MAMNPGSSTEVDREFFEREISSFLPDRIFDAHTHLWRRDCVPWSINSDSEDLGYAQYMSRDGKVCVGTSVQPTDPLETEFDFATAWDEVRHP